MHAFVQQGRVARRPSTKRALVAVACLGVVAGCGGGASDDAYSVGGTVTGLSTPGLVLANGSEAISVSAGGERFEFASRFTGSYNVRVTSQPSGQTCTVQSGTGDGGTNVTDVTVNCRDYVLYASASDAGVVWQYSVGIGAGTLTPLPGVSALTVIAPVTAAAVASVNGLAFLGHRDERRVSCYRVDQRGALEPASTSIVGSETRGVAIVDGKNTLLASNYTDASLTAYAVGADGGLTTRPSGVVSTGRTPTAVVTSPDGANAYVLNAGASSISQLAVGLDGVARSLTPASFGLSSFGQDPVAMASSQDGQRLWVVFADTGRIAQLTRRADGTLASAVPSTATTGPDPRAVVQAGQSGRCVYVTNRGGQSVSVFQLSAGALAAAGSLALPAGSNPSGIVSTPDGTLVVVAMTGTRSIRAYRPDASCALSLTASIDTASTPGVLIAH